MSRDNPDWQWLTDKDLLPLSSNADEQIGTVINSVVLYQKITNDIFVHRNPLFIIGITSMLISIFIFSIGISIDED